MQGQLVSAGLLIGLHWMLVSAVSAGPPENDGSGWKIAQLDLDVTVAPQEKRIHVQGVLELELEADRSYGPSIFLNSRVANMTFTKVEAAEAESIEINQPMPDRESARLAHVRFAAPFAKHDRLALQFAYESSGGSSQFGVGDEAAIASWVDAWHPVPFFDPDTQSLSATSKSQGTITLRLPADWRGAAEGKLTARAQRDGVSVERWVCQKPVARSFAAGRFAMAEQRIGDRTLRVYRLSQSGASPERLASTIGDVLRSLELRFGPYPYDSYSIVETPEGIGSFGAASVQGMIFARPRWFGYSGGSVPLFSHEMAHGWWGNLVGTTGPGSLLCSESLAQYSAALAIESLFGPADATRFMRFSRVDYIHNQCARGYFHIWRNGHDAELSQLRSGGWHHTLSDAKGHWVYHMLRRRVGDEVFFPTLRSLLDRFADRQMSLDDVRSAFLQAAPEAELERFFSQWLDQKGAPVLAVNWEQRGEGKINVTVEQQQPGPPYHLWLDIGLQHDDQVTTRRVELTRASHTFEWDVDELPTAVIADPNHRLLIWTAAYGPHPSTYASSSKLTSEQLQAYVGDYAVDGVGTVRFFLEDNRLMSRVLPHDESSPVEYLGEHQFRTNGLTVSFKIEHGKAVEFVAESGDRRRIGRRKPHE